MCLVLVAELSAETRAIEERVMIVVVVLVADYNESVTKSVLEHFLIWLWFARKKPHTLVTSICVNSKLLFPFLFTLPYGCCCCC